MTILSDRSYLEVVKGKEEIKMASMFEKSNWAKGMLFVCSRWAVIMYLMGTHSDENARNFPPTEYVIQINSKQTPRK